MQKSLSISPQSRRPCARRLRPQRQVIIKPLSATSASKISSDGGDNSKRSRIDFPNQFKDYTSTEKLHLLLEAGRKLPAFPLVLQTIENRVMGCTTRTYLTVELLPDDRVTFQGTSDSDLTKGLITLLMEHLSGTSHDTILSFDPTIFSTVLTGPGFMTASRSNGFLNLVETLKRKTRMLLHDFPKFPSLIITASELIPQGSFAEAQAKYLRPNRQDVERLSRWLEEKKVGVAAHFYMDPEVQGVLSAANASWDHIHISDSLMMADKAVEMAEAGCQCIAVLGVDFMSDNVRMVLDKAGHTNVQVFRMSSDPIGCSLAEAASSDAYSRYLTDAVRLDRPTLHVIYINTSLSTKAKSESIVPTITCTSSNVVPTILQAFAQVEDLRVIYGPDTYMGNNIREMFRLMSEMTDEEIRQLHPEHDRETIQSLLHRFDYFKEGTCIVHHLFGGDVCKTVRSAYGDAYIAAHFEVPGEMFGLAMEAKKRGMGVVGSTSNILNFIRETVEGQILNRTSDRLQFVLGTESGMITSIVNAVTSILQSNREIEDLQVEIVFPVASSAITTEQTKDSKFVLPDALDIVPGPAAGEGCSAEGGCANCPYMKMNSLDALYRVLQGIRSDGTVDRMLTAFEPRSHTEKLKDAKGKDMAVEDLACRPILEMRKFQKTGSLSRDILGSIHDRCQANL